MQSMKVRRGLLSGLLLLTFGNTRSQEVQFDATPPPPNAIITMDQADYEPGETAGFIGRGFEPLEVVTLQVVHADGREDSDADHLPWTVTANENGEITSAWYVGDDARDSMLKLSAVGSGSGRAAAVTFSDGFITNGGFEAGYQGWSVAQSVGPFGVGWYPYGGGVSPISRQSICAPPEGVQAMVADHVGGGFQFLYQDLILESGYTHTLTFKVYYQNHASAFFTPPSLAPAGNNQQYRVDIIKVNAPIESVAAGDVLATPFKTSVGDPNSLPPTLVTVDLTRFAGSTVRLRFAVVVTEQILNGSVDDVKLVSTPQQCLSLQCPPDVETVAEAGQCSAVVNFAPPVPVSACPGVSANVTCAPPSGSTFSVGTTEVKCVATDRAGNSASCSFNVVVKDAEAPQIIVSGPGPIKCNPSAAEVAAAFGKASISDNCSAGLAASEVIEPEKGTGCTRSVTKLWSVTDAAGNTGTASQMVTFTRDLESPVINLAPAAPVGVNPAAAEIAAAFGSASVSDNCSVGLVATGAVLAEQGVGCTRSVTKEWTVVDDCGNRGTASQTIEFTRDIEAPVIIVTPASPLGLNPSESDIAAAFGAASVTDNCSVELTTAGMVQPEQGSGCARSATKIWTATDAAGNVSTVSQTVSFIRDTQAPRILGMSGPTAPIALGIAATVSVSVLDDCSGVQSVAFDWSDGVVSTVDHPAGSTSASHTFSRAGIYPVRVTVTDSAGNKAEDLFQFVVIYDPTAGFITGGGWINSKAGSYALSPSLTGKATFGFVAKYKAGSSVPTGETEFRFGNLKFRSNRYDWLVMDDTVAQCKGLGSVNGVSGYTFLLTIADGRCGGPRDKFRLKIWNGDGTVYDNVMGASDEMDLANPQEISLGRIGIH